MAAEGEGIQRGVVGHGVRLREGRDGGAGGQGAADTAGAHDAEDGAVQEVVRRVAGREVSLHGRALGQQSAGEEVWKDYAEEKYKSGDFARLFQCRIKEKAGFTQKLYRILGLGELRMLRLPLHLRRSRKHSTRTAANFFGRGTTS